MKKLYFLIACFSFCNAVAQIVFPDPDFKNALLTVPTCAYNNSGTNIVVDTDSNGEIDATEALAVYRININNKPEINDLTGLEYFTNINQLTVTYTSCTTLPTGNLAQLVNVHCNDNNITALDLGASMQLETVSCQNNQLTSLIMPQAQTIWKLDCSNNQLTSLAVDFFGEPVAPSHLNCSNNQLTTVALRGDFYDIMLTSNQLVSLDLSEAHSQYGTDFNYNEPLTAVNFKNNFDDFFWSSIASIAFETLPNLQYICTDDAESAAVQAHITENSLTTVHTNTYCSFMPGGSYNSISGQIRFDGDADGCDAGDMGASNVMMNVYNIDEGTASAYYSNASGAYLIATVGFSYMVAPAVEHPEYFSISPAAFEAYFFSGEDVQQDICIAPEGTHHNVSVTVLPVNELRPGFPANYKIVYRNIGNQPAAGSLVFNYNDALTDFSNASVMPNAQAMGELSWNYTALQPLETRTIDIVLNVNTPTSVPPVDLGTELQSEATITAASDEETDNNTSHLNQVAVNSLDPNDKTCLEGDAITPEMVGKYVHYMIRFENNGTANAINVVVEDKIDLEKFDLASLVPLAGSHPFATRITGNTVVFYFENINLPFADESNDGFVAFKIKTLPTLAIGDTFSNTAGIYFDFNHPIVTEPAVTTIAVLGTRDFEFSDYLTVYPNPAKDQLRIEPKDGLQLKNISVYNTLGQLVLAVANAQQTRSIDIAKLPQGQYFLKVETDRGNSNAAFIKK